MEFVFLLYRLYINFKLFQICQNANSESGNLLYFKSILILKNLIGFKVKYNS